jgi:hypothetical protein
MLRLFQSCVALLAISGSLLSGRAHAQVVQGCQPTQYLDRTAPGADRDLLWDFSIATDPERCLQVQAGQSVKWNSNDFEFHPLDPQGGDTPNPIANHQNGLVVFPSTGIFGYVCGAHSSMKGAIKVVAGTSPPPAAAPALPPGLAALLALLLIGTEVRRAHGVRGRRAEP